ncbi:class I SAM-dependent methyltransferase [Bdellovibrionota bacterium FG-2]
MNDSVRSQSFGQNYNPSLIDKFGVWLSSRQIRRRVPDFSGLRIGDFGCGFHASFSRTILNQISNATLIDVAISDELRRSPKVKAFQGDLLQSLAQLDSKSLDVILCVSVLEHIWDPVPVLQEFHRVLAPNGICLLNVPTWRGKWFLEFSAFRLKLSPSFEMDDHKNYYDLKDFWPLLIRAGFKPSKTACFPHKFGLNLFSICRN